MRLIRRARWASGEPRREPGVDGQTLDTFRSFKAVIQGRKGEAAVAALLSDHGLDALHDVILPDDAGLTQIDHLVCSAGAVIVLETKTYGGLITGDPHDATWCQLLRDGSVHTMFQNPMRQNFRHAQAVCRLLDRAGLVVPVRSYLVSAGSARFVPELEPVVVTLPRLARLCLRPSSAPADPFALVQGWSMLAQIAAAHEGQREVHRAALASRKP